MVYKMGVIAVLTHTVGLADPEVCASEPFEQSFTVTISVVALQPVVASVKVKVAVPAEIPVTTPAPVTSATLLLLLIQVPPVVGLNVVVSPALISVRPVMETDGSALISTSVIAIPVHPFSPVKQ